MDVSNFFNRLRQPAEPVQAKQAREFQAQDDIGEFERAWLAIKVCCDTENDDEWTSGITTGCSTILGQADRAGDVGAARRAADRAVCPHRR